jgi:hypothetical protein
VRGAKSAQWLPSLSHTFHMLDSRPHSCEKGSASALKPPRDRPSDCQVPCERCMQQIHLHGQLHALALCNLLVIDPAFLASACHPPIKLDADLHACAGFRVQVSGRWSIFSTCQAHLNHLWSPLNPPSPLPPPLSPLHLERYCRVSQDGDVDPVGLGGVPSRISMDLDGGSNRHQRQLGSNDLVSVAWPNDLQRRRRQVSGVRG